jgi:hypothetical protein
MSMAMENLAIVEHQYTLLCHYLRRWLLALNPHIQAKRLYTNVANNIDYVECDYERCYFVCVEGATL